MGSSLPLRKGSWTEQEDSRLHLCVEKYGQGKWRLVSERAGLNRCRRSCRLRWVNHLKPTIKRGTFEADEIDLIRKMHKLLGNRWSLIAGRLPGRRPNDVKNVWNSKISKGKEIVHNKPLLRTSHISSNPEILRPRPWKCSKPVALMSNISEENQQQIISHDCVDVHFHPMLEVSWVSDKTAEHVPVNEVSIDSIQTPPVQKENDETVSPFFFSNDDQWGDVALDPEAFVFDEDLWKYCQSTNGNNLEEFDGQGGTVCPLLEMMSRSPIPLEDGQQLDTFAEYNMVDYYEFPTDTKTFGQEFAFDDQW